MCCSKDEITCRARSDGLLLILVKNIRFPHLVVEPTRVIMWLQDESFFFVICRANFFSIIFDFCKESKKKPNDQNLFLLIKHTI